MPPPPKDTGYEPRSRSAPRALLRRLSAIMARETEPQARVDEVVRAIAVNMVADVCSIYVRRPDDSLELFATEGLNPEAVHATRLEMDEGLVGWVARQKRPLSLREASRHEAFSYRAETGEERLNAFLGLPIIRSGLALGVLVIQNTAKRLYSEEETEVAQTVATILAEVVSSGELLDARARKDVAALFHKPAYGKGIGIVEGIANGVVFRREPVVRAHPTFAADVAVEQTRLADALADMRKSVDDMIAADSALNSASRDVLEVFRLFAYDKGWARRLEERVLAGLTAESAVEQVQAENRSRMKSASDPYLRERLHDLEDLSRRLLRALSGEAANDIEMPEAAILMAETIGPAELLDLDPDRLGGLVLSEAAGTSHAAIIARALGIPMVSGLGDVVDRAAHGDRALLDGATGEVHLRPQDDVIAAFEEKVRLRNEVIARYTALRDRPAITTDGIQIDLMMNAGLLLDMGNMAATGANGIGLFRTELQFLLGQSLPTAADQEALYRQVLDAAGGKPVVFRTADIGSDKRAGYMDVPREGNPAMGWRGLRMALDRQGLMRTQIRAMLAASEGRPLHFMLPFVSNAQEVELSKEILGKEVARHEKLGGRLPSKISLGAMIEIPAAAWEARQIATACDFVSIGGNDLAQFFFAADRETETVSRRYDPLSPSFLSFLRRTVREAKAGGCQVGYCGEQAADPMMALALVALGVERLSVAASAIGPLKAMFRSVTFTHLRDFVNGLLDQSGDSIRPKLEVYADERGLDLH